MIGIKRVQNLESSGGPEDLRRWLAVAICLVIALVPVSTARAAPCPAPGDTGYWHTVGTQIVDAQGQPVRIAAVNWFGMENKYYVPDGLQKQPLDTILTTISSLGFNTIRLPFSNQLVESNPIVSRRLDANPELQGLHALDVMDRIVAAAGQHGLHIILDNGRSEAGTQPEQNGLWYTKKYPERAWIEDWKTLVTRYRGNPTVVGVDLRNEPHTAPPGPWSLKTYLHQGATWGPYRGKDDKKTDWRLAAERAGDAVLSINPHLLIMVEGIQQYPDKTQPGGVDSYWWGGVLQAAQKYPVRLTVPHQLVYSPHEYGPFKAQMQQFGRHMTYATQVRIWEKQWAFLLRPGFRYRAPIFIGEFGTCGKSPKCVKDTVVGSQGLWFTFLLRYLKSHTEIGWAFWALNGTNYRGDVQPNYILRDDWHSVRLPSLVNALKEVESPACGAKNSGHG